jgi:hypothetical protein
VSSHPSLYIVSNRNRSKDIDVPYLKHAKCKLNWIEIQRV